MISELMNLLVTELILFFYTLLVLNAASYIIARAIVPSWAEQLLIPS